MLFCMKMRRANSTIHARIKKSETEPALPQSEIKHRLTALFALLLEMEIDQSNNVTKDYADEDAYK